jgi:hypothetical protein
MSLRPPPCRVTSSMAGPTDARRRCGRPSAGAGRRTVTSVAIAAATIAACRWVLGPWQRTWGATDAEGTATLVGDDLTAEPVTQTTRAIAIDAPPERIWPWLVQLGADRGGFYSYDWLEDLFGLRIHSATAIVPEWQDLDVGDVVYADRARTGGWVVVALVPDRAVVMKAADVSQRRPVARDEGVGWEFQWTFALEPGEDGLTRLLVRERVAFGRRVTRLLMTPVGLVSFVMTHKMLRGIKERAEAPPATA